MSARSWVVVVQMATMLILAYMFLRDGQWQWSLAQTCYVVATFAIFIAAPEGG